MTLLDQIKADREAGSGRRWMFVETVSPDGQEHLGCGVAEETCEEFIWFDFDPEREIPIARRIARVPDMEAALLAAGELADAVSDLDDRQFTVPLARAYAAFRSAIEVK